MRWMEFDKLNPNFIVPGPNRSSDQKIAIQWRSILLVIFTKEIRKENARRARVQAFQKDTHVLEKVNEITMKNSKT